MPPSRLTGLILLVLGSTVAFPAFARTWTITPEGTGDAPTVQAGIDSAAIGDIVLLEPGVFEEIIDFQGKAITVRGSGQMATILDGVGRGSVVTFDSGEGRSSIVENLLITGGLGTSFEVAGTRRGGGVFIVDAEPTVRNTFITLNSAVTSLAEPDAGEGGGIACWGSAPLGLSPLFEGNRIESNLAGESGGGIAVNGPLVPLIRDNVIRSNQARGGNGGGIWIFVSGDGMTIERNRIAENFAANHGGGIYANPATGVEVARDLTITENVFYRNVAALESDLLAGESGGGIWAENVDAVIRSNTLVENTGEGFELDEGGGILLRGRGQAVIERNIIAFSARGGAIRCGLQTTPVIRNNLVWENVGGEGSGICSGWVDTEGNLSLDPLFCDLEAGDLSLAEDSPALTHPAGLLGADPTAGCPSTPTLRISWGTLKGKY